MKNKIVTRLQNLGFEKEKIDLMEKDLSIECLGECRFDTPIKLSKSSDTDQSGFIPDNERILSLTDKTFIDQFYENNLFPPTFEKAGPRKKLFFQPGETISAIVTCGGLCPGLNAVIRGIVMMNYYRYNNQRTYGIKYGYAGLVKDLGYNIQHLSPREVEGINNQGGTILGSSRGHQQAELIVDRLEELGVNILYTIGGDGTQKGAMAIIKEIKKRNLPIAVIGIPKTIDNDILYIDKSFGVETAFSKACDAIYAAHTEAEASHNGIGIVKLMGRESGFISANATLATNEVNLCLIPEMDFDLAGEGGLFAYIEKRFLTKGHAVIVVAEGAGQKFVQEKDNVTYDASGNVKFGDIGSFLKKEIENYLNSKKIPVAVRYIDPSYIIRSCAPTPNDAIFCAQLAQMAVHAGMSGRTSMIVGHTNGQFVHLPMDLITIKRKKINLASQLWHSVLEATGQPVSLKSPSSIYPQSL